MARTTWPVMLRVVREIETIGHTNLFDYLMAYDAAQTYLGEKLPGPLGARGYNERLLAICVAAHAMRDELRKPKPFIYCCDFCHGPGCPVFDQPKTRNPKGQRSGENMKAHFVTFLSPGTFMAEDTTKPIESWDTDAAVKMARTVKERHGAVPYGFYFTTRERKDDELDSKVVKRSGVYYLGGKVETLAEIAKRDDPREAILRSNMRINGWDRVVVNDNSYRWTQPLNAEDTILDVKL